MNSKNLVPQWVRIVVGLLAVANFLFGVSGYFSPDALFQNSTAGIDLAATGAHYASYEFAARNLAIGVALLIVAAVGVPETIAIMTIVRALIELQTIIIGVVTGNVTVGVGVAVVVFCVEAFVIKTMFGIVAKRDADLHH
jgi:hypothetical protein